MSPLPLNEASGKLYMCSNCTRRYGIIGHASTDRLPSCIIIIIGVAVSIEESAIGTTITTTSNNEQFQPSIVAMQANAPVSFIKKVVAAAAV
jgi:hypothetical protein